MQLNQFIDHTILRPTTTDSDIKNLCAEALEHNFKAVCIPPIYVELASKQLQSSDVALCTVSGFPFGYDHLATKMEAVRRAIGSGADELDVVVSMAAVKNKDWDTLEAEIDSLTTFINRKHNRLLKLILETAYLTAEELEILCNLCVKYGVDFAKTSTGYASRGCTVEDIKTMHKFLGDKVKIKASGGIKTKEFALELINAGATRLGTSSGILLLK